MHKHVKLNNTRFLFKNVKPILMLSSVRLLIEMIIVEKKM